MAEEIVVLWVSRHAPLEGQVNVLREKLGEISIARLAETIPNAEYVINKAKEVKAKYIVPVLPLSIIARLAEVAKKENFEILFAKMENIASVKSRDEAEKIVSEKPGLRSIATYADGVIRVFEFKQFEKLKEVRLITEPF